jgi:outer membrane autotransporter protein
MKGNIMKKSLLAIAMLGAIGTASATEFGLSVNRDHATERNAYGFTLGQKYGSVTAQVGFERFTKGNNDQDRYSAVALYDVAKLSAASVYVKGGAAYLNNQVGADGFAWLAGVGVNIPVAKNVSAVVDLTHQFGQNRVSRFDGNTFGVGLKVSF